MTATHPRTPRWPRTRRTKNYWEPVYEANAAERFPYADWATVQKHGATLRTLDADDLAASLQIGLYPKLRGVAFKNCDFFGYFDQVNRVIVFEGCDFDFCDFGLSTWRRAKFTNCNFRHTSITQCTLTECEFRGCTWANTGLSGNETRFERTLIDNPSEFIGSAFLNVDESVLKAYNKNREQQLVRFWETKSVVARQIYNDLKVVGDEDSFYDACRAFILSTSRYKLERAWRPGKRKDGVARRINPFKLIGSLTEIGFIRLIATINNWGESVIRPLFLLVLCFVLYAIVYYIAGYNSFAGSVAKSFEITSVAGYTRGAAAVTTRVSRLLEWSNLAAAIILYTVFVSTIVAKVCRVR